MIVWVLKVSQIDLKKFNANSNFMFFNSSILKTSPGTAHFLYNRIVNCNEILLWSNTKKVDRFSPELLLLTGSLCIIKDFITFHQMMKLEQFTCFNARTYFLFYRNCNESTKDSVPTSKSGFRLWFRWKWRWFFNRWINLERRQRFWRRFGWLGIGKSSQTCWSLFGRRGHPNHEGQAHSPPKVVHRSISKASIFVERGTTSVSKQSS